MDTGLPTKTMSDRPSLLDYLFTDYLFRSFVASAVRWGVWGWNCRRKVQNGSG
jgi:hypothetical protein